MKKLIVVLILILFIHPLYAGTGTASDVNIIFLTFILISLLVLGIISIYIWVKNFIFKLFTEFYEDFDT